MHGDPAVEPVTGARTAGASAESNDDSALRAAVTAPQGAPSPAAASAWLAGVGKEGEGDALEIIVDDRADGSAEDAPRRWGWGWPLGWCRAEGVTRGGRRWRLAAGRAWTPFGLPAAGDAAAPRPVTGFAADLKRYCDAV